MSSIYEVVKKATVAIVRSIPNKAPLPYSIVGSGFCIDPVGIIVTCEHVFREFLTPQSRDLVKQAKKAAAGAEGKTVPIHGAIPHVLFYLGVQGKEHRINTCLVPVSHAVTEENFGFDLAVLKLPRNEQIFPEGYPHLRIAEYTELHETMEIATCGFPLGNWLLEQIGTATTSFTKGMISSIIPAQGVPREYARGFQLDLTTTYGNSGGPVFSVATGHVFGVLKGGVTDHLSGDVVPGFKKAEPVYPIFDAGLIDRLPKQPG